MVRDKTMNIDVRAADEAKRNLLLLIHHTNLKDGAYYINTHRIIL